MRKGYLLVEMLTVISVFAMLLIPVGYTTKVLMSGIPRSQKVIEVNTSMINAMMLLRKDVSNANNISKSSEGNILLTFPDRQIKYILDDGFVEKIDGQQQRRWNIPKGKFTFEITNDPAAIEVITYIEFKDNGKIEKKFSNSYLLFANVLTTGGPNGQSNKK